MKNYDYHTKQFQNIKRSTVQFVSWLDTKVSFERKRILDMACGAGANTFYLSALYPNTSFIGMDFDQDILELRNNMCLRGDVEFTQGDWYNLEKKWIDFFDGIISFQTLSWLSDYREPIEHLCELNPEWIALSSLFYEGKINYYIQVDDHEEQFDGWGKDGKSYYNIYSLPLVKELFYEHGYTNFYCKNFEIDMDLPKPNSYRMGTYTIMTADQRRMQISGALLMPWYFVLATK